MKKSKLTVTVVSDKCTSERSDYGGETSNALKQWKKHLGNLSSSDLKHLSRLGLLDMPQGDLRKPLIYVRCAEGKSYTRYRTRKIQMDAIYGHKGQKRSYTTINEAVLNP